MRKVWIYAFAVALSLSLGLNAYLYTTLRGAEAGGPIHVKIGTMRAFSYLPVHVAHSLGYFEDEGLDVELVFFGSGSKNREALIAGDVDFSTLALVHVLIAREKGRPIKVVGALQDMEFFDVVVRSDLRDEVRSLEDLRGRRIGISKPGSGSWAWGVVYLKRAGLDPDTDVEFVSVDGVTTMYAALKAGKVDAVIAWNPLTVRAVREGVGYVLLSIHDRNTHIRYVGGESALSGVLATRSEVLRERPGLVFKVMRAINRALRYIHTHRPEEIAEVVRGLYEGVEPDLLADAIEYELPTYPESLSPSKRAFDVEVDVYLGVGIIKSRADYSEAVEWQVLGWRP